MKKFLFFCAMLTSGACAPDYSASLKQKWEEEARERKREETKREAKRLAMSDAFAKQGKECRDRNESEALCSCYKLHLWQMAAEDDKERILLKETVISEKGVAAWHEMPESGPERALSEKVLSHCKERASLLADARGRSNAREIYDCTKECGFGAYCGFEDGFIESTANPDEYRYVHIDIGENEIDGYSFYKVPADSMENAKEYDKYETSLSDVYEQTLYIDRKSGAASFNNGPDFVIECKKIE
ncbi:MAG: hypothetical protein LBI17_04110 [Rickettsiales bacterium]|jgi:hypothetical protein|nr:hypothetical protein [Rickettsiales bacterium]